MHAPSRLSPGLSAPSAVGAVDASAYAPWAVGYGNNEADPMICEASSMGLVSGIEGRMERVLWHPLQAVHD